MWCQNVWTCGYGEAFLPCDNDPWGICQELEYTPDTHHSETGCYRLLVSCMVTDCIVISDLGTAINGLQG